MTDAEQIRAFCSALLGGSTGDGDDRLSGLRAYLWSIGTDDAKRTRWERADDLESIVSAATSLAVDQPARIAHVYLGTGLVDADHPDTTRNYRRAKNGTVSGVFAFCVDIDIAGGVHTSKPYPPTVEDARRIWESVPLKPTIVAHSGNGLQIWWALVEPWIIEPEDDARTAREAMYALARDWSSTLKYHAHRIGGWEIDSTFDLARVMRVPGTTNVKGTHVTHARILEIDPGARYELDDFREALADPEVVRTYGATGGAITVAELPGVDLTRIWARVTSTAYRDAEYTPPWLAGMLELLPGSALEAVWEGNKTLNGDTSPSGVDASLARLLINTGRVDDERLVEAIMCRRLRTGDGVDKVDPGRRTSYLKHTITRIRALAAQDNAPAKADFSARMAEIRNEVKAGPSAAEVSHLGDEEREIEDVALEEIAEDMPSTTIAAPPRIPESPDSPPPPPPRSISPARTSLILPPRPSVPPPLSVWPERPNATASIMKMLSEILFQEDDQEQGVEVFGLEFRDHGEAQRGRMILRVPQGYTGWPVKPPPIYRPHRPLYCEWYKRDAFDVPAAYRKSVTRDALLRAQDVADRRDEWKELLRELPPHWTQDSSGSDMVTQMHEWLVGFLRWHVPTTIEQVAALNRRSYLIDHAEWGATGLPTLYINQTSFLDYIARQQGGVKGRDGRTLLGYLDLSGDRRPYLTGPDGRRRRSGWLEVHHDELSLEEWADLLEAARESLEADQLRAVKDKTS